MFTVKGLLGIGVPAKVTWTVWGPSSRGLYVQRRTLSPLSSRITSTVSLRPWGSTMTTPTSPDPAPEGGEKSRHQYSDSNSTLASLQRKEFILHSKSTLKCNAISGGCLDTSGHSTQPLSSLHTKHKNTTPWWSSTDLCRIKGGFRREVQIQELGQRSLCLQHHFAFILKSWF